MKRGRRHSISVIGLGFFVLISFTMMVHAEGPLYVAVEGGSSPGIWRLEDIDGDNEISKPGEMVLYAIGPPNGFNDVAASSDGILYTIAPNTRAVYRVEDRNNDGDALDAGEVTVFRDETSTPLGIGMPLSVAVTDFYEPTTQTNRTWVYVYDLLNFLTLRLEDIDGDGNAHGSGEASIAQKSTDTAPLTANRMTVDELGRIVACNLHNITIDRLTDINGDGFVNPPDFDIGCPLAACGATDFHEFHTIRQHIANQQNLVNPYGVTLSSEGDYYVSDELNNELAVIKLSDLNGDDDALENGELSTYYLGSGHGALDLVADESDAIYVIERLPGEAFITRLVDIDGNGNAMGSGEATVYADFAQVGTPVGLAVEMPQLAPMFLMPGLTHVTMKGNPILVVEGGLTAVLTLQAIDQVTQAPVPNVRVASAVVAGCFELCPLSERTDTNGQINYEVTRTADSPTGGETLRFWLHGDAALIAIVETPCEPFPVANAGADRRALTGGTRLLNGSGSIGEGLVYCWEQVGGPDVGLPECSNLTALTPILKFTAPDTPTTLTFALTVRNACGDFSNPDEVVIDVIECPATAVLSGDSDGINTLYQFRDGVLAGDPDGQRVIDGLYTHAQELTQVVRNHTFIRRRALRLLQTFMPMLRQRLAGESVVIRRAELQDVDEFLADSAFVASPELQSFLNWARGQLADEGVLNRFGIRIGR